MVKPRHFRYFHEIESRDAFDSEASITPSNFKDLIGPYDFGEEVKCQVLKSHGNCGRMHLHGWLGITKEGKEVLIGGHCAPKYFHADKRFAQARSRIRRELNINDYIERLSELLADRGEFIGRVNAEINRLEFVRDSIRSISGALPDSVVKILRDMSKTGNRAVAIQVQYVEKDEDGKETIEWIDQSIGSMSGVAIWEASRVNETHRQLEEIRQVAQAVKIEKEAGERRLKIWLDTLGELPRCASRIDDLEKDFDNFSTFENIRNMCFLIRNRDEQSEMARYALRYKDVENPSLSQGKELLKEMNSEIRSAVGSRNFRVL